MSLRRLGLEEDSFGGDVLVSLVQLIGTIKAVFS